MKNAYEKANVILSSDSEKIVEMGINYGWNVPFIRPRSLAKDDTSTYSVVNNILKWRNSRGMLDPKYVVLLQPTSPFRTSDNIREGCKILISNDDYNGVVGVKYLKHTADSMKIINKNNYLEKCYNNNLRKAKLLQPNGAFYGIKTDVLKKHKTFIPINTVPFIMSEYEAIDIDTYYDWEIAEYFSKKLLPNLNDG